MGITLYNQSGFSSVMLMSAVFPVIGVIMFSTLQKSLPIKLLKQRNRFYIFLGHMDARAGCMLQGVGFAVLGAFYSLYLKIRMAICWCGSFAIGIGLC